MKRKKKYGGRGSGGRVVTPLVPQHIMVWTKAPPFAKVYVTPWVAHSGARYLSSDDPIVALGQAQPGIHVAVQAHKDDILRAERRAS